MKIAIYHNLHKGGGLVQLSEFINFAKKYHKIDVYSLNSELKNTSGIEHYQFNISSTKNLIHSLYQSLIELPAINKLIAKEIIRKDYEAVLVFPCSQSQSPDILRYLKKQNTTYIFAEPKREFYEKTSFDHYSPKRILARIIRLPAKYVDLVNCKSAPQIITNSLYSQKQLREIYGRNSVIIYPGLVDIEPKTISVSNNRKVLIVGQLSYIKGYEIALNLLHHSNINQITVVGRRTSDYFFIKKIADKLSINLNLIESDDNSIRNKQYRSHTFVLCCQINEPFGITSLEACYNNCVVFGLNEGGTPEIIRHGLNGYTFERNSIKKAATILANLRRLKKIEIIKTNSIDWSHMSAMILKKITNE